MAFRLMHLCAFFLWHTSSIFKPVADMLWYAGAPPHVSGETSVRTIYSTELLLYCYFAAHGEANSFCSLPCWDLGTKRLGNNRIPWSLTNSKLDQLHALHCSLFSFLKSETLRRNIHTRSRSRGSPCHQRRRPNPSNTTERSTMNFWKLGLWPIRHCLLSLQLCHDCSHSFGMWSFSTPQLGQNCLWLQDSYLRPIFTTQMKVGKRGKVGSFFTQI